jgi:hypothetical protein
MGEDLIDGKTDQLAIQMLELASPPREGHELGCSYEGEVPRMTEQHEPFPGHVPRQPHLAMCCHNLNVREGFPSKGMLCLSMFDVVSTIRFTIGRMGAGTYIAILSHQVR